nr:transposase [uncultured Capnocytophaga sp.]
MAKLQFKNEPNNSPELFPENIFDKIPQGHPVRLFKKVVEGLNINHILKHYKTGSAPAYHPRTMIKILFYSYLSNIYSCRKIAKALNENIHFRLIEHKFVYL